VTPRRVGANLLWLVPGVVGGSEEYTVRLLTAFAEQREEHPDLDLTLFVNRSLLVAHPDLVAALPTVVAPVPGTNRVVRVGVESTWLVAQARRRRIEVMHHMGGTMPPLRPCPGLVTIHDLQPFDMPGHFSPLKRAYIRLVVPPSVRAARVVVTLTRWTQRDVVRHFDVPADRLWLVPSGIDLPPLDVDPTGLDATLARHDLVGHPYFLYPAITYPHKNHATLVRAFAAVAARHPEAALVLTGGFGPSEAEVAHLVADLGLEARVRRPGRVPRAELDALYRRATAVTFASRYEGFGIPVLEAMSRACPVLASDVGGLPEVIGDAGVLIAPDDVAGWASAMDRLLDDGARRQALAAAGRVRAEAFPWRASAESLAALYRAVLEAPRSTGRGRRP